MFSVSLWLKWLNNHHRDTENTEVAQRNLTFYASLWHHSVPHMRHSNPSGLVVAALVAMFFYQAQVMANPLAQKVTIYRDTYGVPHVFGRTDASTVFGFAYAQAEDNFWRVEENFISALGRSSEVYGEKALEEDRLNQALEIPRLAREEYARLDGHMRSLCDAFAAGFNYYLERHPKLNRACSQKSNRGTHSPSFVTTTTKTASRVIETCDASDYKPPQSITI